ncbi:hypothetical protein H1R20_g3089, partial [Candolleomyces eurysporus]
MWSDPNLQPFMAVTAHWIEPKTVQTAEGPVTDLQLGADLIAFHNLPGRHTGEHLANALVFILDRLKLTNQLGWITVDNASNNDTMMDHLSDLLSRRGINFSETDNRIRCFPHITNLASKAVLTAITNIRLAAVNDDEVTVENEVVETGLSCNVIALARSLIRMIRASSLRRDKFAALQRTRNPKKAPLELLRDVDTRWSSTLLMIERLVALKEFVVQMISNFTHDLKKYELLQNDWDVLQTYIRILQQKLSHKKIPTLHQALPSFHRMITVWERLKCELPSYASVIGAGISKLKEYWKLVENVPAYTLAQMVTPTVKLEWYQKNAPGRVDWAKDLFVDTLKLYCDACSMCTPATTQAQRDAQPNPSTWADNILGSPIADRRHQHQA